MSARRHRVTVARLLAGTLAASSALDALKPLRGARIRWKLRAR